DQRDRRAVAGDGHHQTEQHGHRQRHGDGQRPHLPRPTGAEGVIVGVGVETGVESAVAGPYGMVVLCWLANRSICGTTAGAVSKPPITNIVPKATAAEVSPTATYPAFLALPPRVRACPRGRLSGGAKPCMLGTGIPPKTREASGKGLIRGGNGPPGSDIRNRDIVRSAGTDGPSRDRRRFFSARTASTSA